MPKKWIVYATLTAAAVLLAFSFHQLTESKSDECSDIVSISAGGTHALFITSEGTVCAAGTNYRNQLGLEDTSASASRPIPVALPEVKAISSFTASGRSAIVSETGHIWYWGERMNENEVTPPIKLEGIDEVQHVVISGPALFALKKDGSVWTYAGDDWSLFEAGPIIEMDSDHSYLLMLTADGLVKGWGYNTFGQLGDLPDNPQDKAQSITGLSDIASVRAGARHMLALDHAGAVYATGTILDEHNNPARRNEPFPVSGLPSIKAVDAGFAHSIAIDMDNRVWTWGENLYGQLGTGDTGSKAKPVQIKELQANVWAAGALFNVIYGENGTFFWGSVDGDRHIQTRPVKKISL